MKFRRAQAGDVKVLKKFFLLPFFCNDYIYWLESQYVFYEKTYYDDTVSTYWCARAVIHHEDGIDELLAKPLTKTYINGSWVITPDRTIRNDFKRSK